MASAQKSEEFHSFFKLQKLALEQQIDRLGARAVAGGERFDAAEHCSASIVRLSNEVRGASSFLPAYDQQKYSDSIKELQGHLQKMRDAFAPKPKFTFKSARKSPSAVSISDAAELASQQPFLTPGFDSSRASSMLPTPEQPLTPPNEPLSKMDDTASSMDESSLLQPKTASDLLNPSADQYVNLRDIHDDCYTRASDASKISKPVTVTDIERSIIDLTPASSDAATPSASITLKNVGNSLLILGSISGPVHITGIKNCVLVLSCRQFRMHESSNVDVYLAVSSRPIVEDVKGIRFAQLPKFFSKITNQADGFKDSWDEVDDFKWPNPGPSPNWKVVPQVEQLSDDIWAVIPDGTAWLSKHLPGMA